VRKSLVLLKNGKTGAKPLLPLPKKSGKILVAGAHADNLGYQCGGWTITWQGLNGNDHTVGMFTHKVLFNLFVLVATTAIARFWPSIVCELIQNIALQNSDV